MRVVGAVVVAILALVILVSVCGDGEPDDSTTAATVDPADCLAIPAGASQLTELQNYIVAQLADYRLDRHDNTVTLNLCWHDWSTDGCSGPIGDRGPGFEFSHPCHRHDFGYRNYKRLERENAQDWWTETTKLEVDDRFLEDLREHCSTRPGYQKTLCFGWAEVYYWAVRSFGGWRDPLL